MIALYIILGIIALILLLLLCSARIRITYGEEFTLTVKYLFLKFAIFPKKEKPKKKSENKPSEKKEKPKEKIDKSIKKQGFADTFSQLKSEIAPAFKALGKFIKHIRVNPFKFRLIMAGKDAGDLAIDYGRLCAVFYPTFAFLCSNMTFKNKNVYIGVDYIKENHEIDLDTTLKIKLIFALALGIKLIYRLVKVKLKASNSNSVKKNIKNQVSDKERTVAK